MNCQIKSLFPLPSCKKIVALAAVSFCLLGAGRAQAQTTIDYFNFNNGLTSGTTATTPVTHANGGGGNGPTNDAITPTNIASSNIVYIAGSSVNAQGTDASGNSLSIQGGTGATASGTGGNNGGYITLNTTSSNYTNTVLTYATVGGSTGFRSDQLSYSTDNITYTSFQSPYDPYSSNITASTYYLQTYNFGSLLDNQANVYLRITFNGATASNGSNRIDNLRFAGNPLAAPTPAPPGIVSAGIGFAVTGFGALLRRRKHSKSPDTATPEAAA